MTTQSFPLVSIIVPMRNEHEFIQKCLFSLQNQTYPSDRVEILVIDGQSTDDSKAIVERLSTQDHRIRIVDNPKRHQAVGLNIGIDAACGEVIVRADAHAIYGETYVEKIVAHLVANEADNVGGPQRGEGTTTFGKAVAAALNTPLGAGNAPYRLAKTTRYVDTVWLGAWYKTTLQKIGGFDESMIANQDYECNCRLRKAGGRILFDPSLPSTYFTRSSPVRLAKQYFRYGMYKVLTIKRHPDSLVLRQLLPPIAIMAIVCALLLIPWTPWVVVLLGGAYVAAVLLTSLHVAIRQGWRMLPALLCVFPIMHFAWAFGFYWGILRFRGFPLHVRGMVASERLVQTGQEETVGPLHAGGAR